MAPAQTVTFVTPNTFFRDLEEGKRWEHLCAQIVRWTTHHKAMTLAPPKCKGWDLIDHTTGWRIEVKMDARSQSTGRFLLELEMFGKPSGLMACEADEWVWWDGAQYLFFPLAEARQLLEFAGEICRLTAPGDSQPKVCRFVPREAVLQRARRRYTPLSEMML